MSQTWSKAATTAVALFSATAQPYCPTSSFPMDIAPPALISALQASPFHTTFTRQMNAARNLYDSQLAMPKIKQIISERSCARFWLGLV